MEEIKDLIKQEDYEKYKKLLQEFECKAIDIIEDLTYQFKETLAEDIDRKIKGWKDEYERLLKENWKKYDRIAELEKELAELKEKYNKTNEKLKNITEEIDNNFVDGQDYEKLKQELLELKEKAIIPKFKIGQEVYHLLCNNGRDAIITKDTITNIYRYDDLYVLDKSRLLAKKSDLYVTHKEAEKKLQELRGGE